MNNIQLVGAFDLMVLFEQNLRLQQMAGGATSAKKVTTVKYQSVNPRVDTVCDHMDMFHGMKAVEGVDS